MCHCWCPSAEQGVSGWYSQTAYVTLSQPQALETGNSLTKGDCNFPQHELANNALRLCCCSCSLVPYQPLEDITIMRLFLWLSALVWCAWRKQKTLIFIDFSYDYVGLSHIPSTPTNLEKLIQDSYIVMVNFWVNL